MAGSHIEHKVVEILAEQLGIAEDDIAAEASLSGDLGADTLDVLEVMMALEEEFEIEIPEDVAHRLETVGQIVQHLEQLERHASES